MYGLIVIGDDLSSHVAAAIASSKGIKTALITENDIAGSCIIGDLAFNTDTTPFAGLGESQTFSAFLKELGILPKTSLLNPAYQIILPENRLDFFNDKEELIKELAREFPDLATGIKSFYDAIAKNSARAEKWLTDHPYIQPQSLHDYFDYLKLFPYLIKSIIDNVRLKRLVARNSSFKKVMEAQRVLLTFKINNQNSIFSDFIFCAPLRGIYNFSDGKQAFIDSLIKKLDMADGLYLKNHEILSIKKGKIIELTYMDKNGVASKIEADNLIVSTKWQNMRLIIDRKKKFSFSDYIRPTKISYYPFTIHLGISPNCIPEKIARHVAVISDVSKDIYDNNLIILEYGVSQIEKSATLSKVPLSATVFLPDNQDTWSRDNLDQTANSMIERLAYFLPFLKDNIEFFDINESINISQKQRNIVNPKYQIRNSFLSGFVAKNNKTRFGNIYLTGGSLLADAGFEGEIISGMNAAEQLNTKRK